MIARLIKFLYNDIKHDLSVWKAIITGKAKPKYPWKELLNIDWKQMFKNYWLMFLLIILAFCVGYWFASRIYWAKCVGMIENITPEWVYAARQM